MGVESPPRAWQTARYLMGEPLQHEPGGGDDPYCNVCYMLAGLVAEAATGAELEALYDAYLFRPLEVQGDIERGYALPEDRNPREPFYACNEEMPNVFRPNETVCAPDGGWSMEAELGNGGLVATASAVAAVYEAYDRHAPEWLHLDAGAAKVDCAPDAECRWHSGAFPGTASVAGVVEGEDWSGQFVLLFNKLVLREGVGGCSVPGFDCTNGDLHWEMFPLTQAWARGDGLAPGGGGTP